LGPISKILKRKSKGDTETYESFQPHFNALAPRSSLTVRALFVRPLRSTRIGDSFHLQEQSFEVFRAVSARLCFRARSLSLFALLASIATSFSRRRPRRLARRQGERSAFVARGACEDLRRICAKPPSR
jgi:hypothetical protein